MTEMKLIRVEKMCTPKPERGDIPFKQFIILKHSLTALNQCKALEFHPLHEIKNIRFYIKILIPNQ